MHIQQWDNAINLLSANNLNFPIHIHNSVEIVLVKSGRSSISISNGTYPLTQGDIAVIFPGQMHSYTSLSSDSFLHMLIFHPNLIAEYTKIFEQFLPKCPVLTSNIINNDVNFAFKKLYKNESTCHQALKTAWIHLILAYILSELDITQKILTGETDLTYRIINYLSQHYTEHISLDVLSKELHVNKYYLSHTFTSKIGMSLTDYTNHLRVDSAISMLSSTSHTISYISEQSGFETQRNFNRVFKAITGMTPKEYRSNKAYNNLRNKILT